MAKEVIIVTWCDRCAGLGQEKATAHTIKSVNSNGAIVEVDLCQDCHEEVLTPALVVLDSYGRIPESLRRKKGNNAPLGHYDCPECPRDFTTPQGLGAHRRRTHGYASQQREAVRRRAKKAAAEATAAAPF